MVQARLGDRLGVDKAAIVPNLNGLESSGLVERRNHLEDDRAFVVYLLPAGLQMLKRAEKVNRLVSENSWLRFRQRKRSNCICC